MKLTQIYNEIKINKPGFKVTNIVAEDLFGDGTQLTIKFYINGVYYNDCYYYPKEPNQNANNIWGNSVFIITMNDLNKQEQTLLAFLKSKNIPYENDYDESAEAYMIIISRTNFEEIIPMPSYINLDDYTEQ